VNFNILSKISRLRESCVSDEESQAFKNRVKSLLLCEIRTTTLFSDFKRELPFLQKLILDPIQDLDDYELTYPATLQGLRMRNNFPHNQLPESLLVLQLGRFYCTELTLLELMARLSRQCPNLKELEIGWLSKPDSEEPSQVKSQILS